MRRSPTGFTLVELLIAIAIGSLIVLVAFAALRSTERAYRRALAAREVNTLLVAGYRAAMAECDRWHAFDDASDPAAQALRGGQHPFTPIDLPDAAWRWAPHDSRLWDRSGMRRFQHRYRNEWEQWDYWPDHSQIAGIGHGHADAEFLHRIQRELWTSGGIPLVQGTLPDHVPLGYIDNATGWYQSAHNRTLFAAPRSWAGDGMHRALLWSNKRNNWEQGDWQAAFQGGRNGALDHGKRWHLAPRPGWSAVNTATNDAAELVRTSFQRRTGDLIELPLAGTSHDALQFAAGHPAFRGGDAGRYAHRFAVWRHTHEHGRRTVAQIDIVDNETGERITLDVPVRSTSLRGARILRRLDR